MFFTDKILDNAEFYYKLTMLIILIDISDL